MPRRALSILFTGLFLGGVIAAGSVVTVPPAIAAPGYPSWDDVVAARGNAAATESKIQQISGLIATLAQTSEQAAQHALEAGERAQVAELKRAEAAQAETDLEARLSTAHSNSDSATHYLGATVAQLARSGTHGSVETLVSSGGDSDDLLYRLGALEKLTGTQSESLLRARKAVGEVESLTAQSVVATGVREKAATEQRDRAADAEVAADAAERALGEQRTHGAELTAQLAVLKDKTVDVEQRYREGEAARIEAERQAAEARAAAQAQAQAERQAAQARAAAQAQAEADRREAERAQAQHRGGGSAPSGSRPGGRPHRPSPSRPGAGWRPSPAPKPTPVAPAPGPVVPPPAPGGASNSAVRFARAQLGKWYRFGGEGPSTWDCSGLTMVAYRQAGVYIGYHTVGAQYRYLSSVGRLASVSSGLKPGDLLFYNRGSSTTSYSMYHITMYVGNGQMIEAPQPGERVKISPVRTRNLVPWAGRPA